MSGWEHDSIADDVTALVCNFDDPFEQALVLRAAEYGQAAHRGVRRRSGEPFFAHPVAVARIVADEQLSAVTVAAALLHDVLEDCPGHTEADLTAAFGDEITALVCAVTKITRVAPRGSRQREQIQTYRKLVLAAADDARCIMLKLADRLHNMRTITALSRERQQRIAIETLEVYAPLAHRLGMGRIKDELQDLAFATLDPRAWEDAELLRAERARSTERTFQQMTSALTDALTARDVQVVDISTRVKTRFSIHHKLTERGDDREDLHDILGLRVIVADVRDCYAALGEVHLRYTPRLDRFKDYIAIPKPNLYQSLHTTVIGPAGHPVEVQIRTTTMHEIAERGIAAHWLYKERLSDGGPGPTREFIGDLAVQSTTMEDVFQSIRREVFSQEIYVFTPRGDVKLLPRDATPVDFAYSVHTELGHCCVGARVDGRMWPLNRSLPSGATVEIIRSDRAAPREDWLSFVVTARARSRIRGWMSKQRSPEIVARGSEHLRAALHAAGLRPLTDPDRLADIAEQLGYDSIEAMAAACVTADRATGMVGRIVRTLPDRQQATRTSRDSSDITVVGLQDVLTRLAGCCAPEPGDAIVGFVSLRHGVTVHRRDCQQLIAQGRGRDTRLCDVKWPSGHTVFRAQITVVFRDRPELLGDLALAIYDQGAEVNSVALRADRQFVRGVVTINASSAEQAEAVRDAVASLDGALRIDRS